MCTSTYTKAAALFLIIGNEGLLAIVVGNTVQNILYSTISFFSSDIDIFSGISNTLEKYGVLHRHMEI